MTPYEALRGDMDAQVDNHLGDSISAIMKAGGTRELVGYILHGGADAGAEGMNSMRNGWYASISKAQLPDGPASIVRMTAMKLPGVYRPAVDKIDEEGDDYVFDLQKAEF